MRFLCDEMLARLARLLRAAGYDTVLSQGGASDDALVRQAGAERRIILTRDRELAALAGPKGLLVSGQGAMGEAHALTRALSVDWALAPFTRCVMDIPISARRAPRRSRGCRKAPASGRARSASVPPARGSTGRAVTPGGSANG